MPSALHRLVAWVTGRESGDPDETDSSDDSTFAGSLLDSSVNYSHGQSDAQAASEMAEIQADAERLAEQDQHRER